MAASGLNQIKEAAGLVEVCLDQERDALQGWERSREYELSRRTELTLKRRLPLPKALFDQYSHLECKSFMGIFPEIHRAWFTVDNRLFLWNYATGSDFYPFEGIDQIITSAAIVEPKPGIFVEDVKYLLALSTTVEVVLLGVCFSGPSVSSEITLVPTQMTVTTDGVAMLKIVGSRGRRLFMAGRDGCLHELTYQGELPGFFSLNSRKARKLNHSRTAFSTLIPSSVRLFFTGDDPLIDLAIDDNRDLLYSLSERGIVTAYDISKPTRAYRLTSADATADARRYYPSSSVRERAFLSIAAVSLQTSSTINLVVVTTLGERVYYSLRSNRGPLRSLSAVGFRGTPPLRSEAFHPSVHTSAWIRGSLFLADAQSGDADTLVAVYPEKAPQPRGNESFRFKSVSVPIEIVAETPLDAHGGFAKAWAIAEASRPDMQAITTGSGWNPPQEIIVLTNSAIHLYSRVGSREHLEQLLSSNSGTAQNEIQALFQYYGAKEACAMCLSLAADRNAQYAGNADVFTAATRTFFARGGDPSFEDFEDPRQGPNLMQFDIGRPSASPPPLKFSSAHDGLCLHIARIVSEIWWAHVTSSRRPEDYQTLNFRKETLMEVREKLLATVIFMEKNGSMFESKRTESQQKSSSGRASIQDRLYKGLLPKKRSDEAMRLEQISIGNLIALAGKTAEALSLLSVLSDNQFHRVAANLMPANRQELVKIRFFELVVSESGTQMCNILLEALFASYSDQPQVIEALSDGLRERAPAFFGDAEVALHRGLMLTRSAARTSGPEALSLASEAVKELKPFAGRIPDLKAICTDLRQCGALAALAELAIAAATAGETNGDPAVVDVACSCVFDSLELLILAETEPKTRAKEAMMRILTENATDSFAERLYAFLESLGPLGAEELFNWPSTRLEKFLETHDVNLLWKYFAKHGRNVDAAVVLVALAEDSAQDASLNERVSYIASAVHNAKVAASSGSDERATSLLRRYTDLLDVAQVQLRVLEELKRRRSDEPDSTMAVDELSRNLLDLSTLYNTYARPWELWESELDALRCASYRDDELVKKLWTDIVDAEIASSASSPNGLSARMASLGRDFYPSATAFPVLFIIEILESRTIARRNQRVWADRKGWVASTMVDIGVSRREIVSSYGSILDHGQLIDESGWDRGVSLYVIEVITGFLTEWTRQATKSDSSRRELSSVVADIGKTISICRGLLRSLTEPKAADMIKELDALEARVEKLGR